MTKAQEFRDQSIEELEALCIDKRKQLFDLVNERKMSQDFKQPHLIKEIRKDIARLLTVISEKEKLGNA